MKPLSIGITLRNDQSQEQVFFGNGLSQNVKFLYDLFIEMGHNPFFIVSIPLASRCMSIQDKNYSSWTMEEMLDNIQPIDVVIEAGVSVSQRDRAIYRKVFGAKIVSMRYGHSMYMDMEQLCYKETLTPGMYINKPDVVWISPHFVDTISYIRLIYSAPVRVASYIWEPDFVGDPFTSEDCLETPDIYVMEPNISFLKNALIPMAIIEAVYREAPNSFGKATILNGLSFNNQKFFLDNIVKNMSSLLSGANKVYFAGRAKFDEVFKRRDILLCYQHHCELNYLYLEAIYKNVPIVHNSEALREVGYYYNNSYIETGKDSLSAAIRNSTVDYFDLAEADRSILSKYSIRNNHVQFTYANLLEELLYANT